MPIMESGGLQDYGLTGSVHNAGGVTSPPTDRRSGEVPEWTNGRDWKSRRGLASRGFESRPLRQNYPGRKLVDEATTGDVLSILTPIWPIKPETASRVSQRMETVCDWTVAQGWRPDNPAGKGRHQGPAPGLPAEGPPHGPALWRGAGGPFRRGPPCHMAGDRPGAGDLVVRNL